MPESSAPFSTEEMDQLTDVLDLSQEELDEVIETATYIFQVAFKNPFINTPVPLLKNASRRALASATHSGNLRGSE